MATATEVYNLAGAAIGSGRRVTDPDENTTLARSIKAVWNTQRQAAIREGAWSFATQRFRLPALVAPPVFGYAYEYELPATFLRLLEVTGQAESDYQVEGRSILADVRGPLDVRCLVDVEEPAKWDADFADALGLRLAWAVGTKVAGDAFDNDKVWTSYQASLMAAKRIDAMENPAIENVESDWILARHSPAPYTGRS
jgi:hypothetical protein